MVCFLVKDQTTNRHATVWIRPRSVINQQRERSESERGLELETWRPTQANPVQQVRRGINNTSWLSLCRARLSSQPVSTSMYMLLSSCRTRKDIVATARIQERLVYVVYIHTPFLAGSVPTQSAPVYAFVFTTISVVLTSSACIRNMACAISMYVSRAASSDYCSENMQLFVRPSVRYAITHGCRGVHPRFLYIWGQLRDANLTGAQKNLPLLTLCTESDRLHQAAGVRGGTR